MRRLEYVNIDGIVLSSRDNGRVRQNNPKDIVERRNKGLALPRGPQRKETQRAGRHNRHIQRVRLDP